MGLFGAAQGLGGGSNKAPLLKMSHTFPAINENSHSYNLPKEDPKKYQSRETNLEFC